MGDQTDVCKRPVWLLLIGVLMIGMGFYVFMNPLNTILAVAMYIGIVFIISGFSYISTYLASRTSGWFLANGLLDIVIGLFFIANLGLTAMSLPIMLAFWMAFIGILRIMAAFHMRSLKLPMWGWPLVFGLLSIVLGFMVLANPVVGKLTITFMVGSYMIMYGFFDIAEFFGWFRRKKTF